MPVPKYQLDHLDRPVINSRPVLQGMAQLGQSAALPQADPRPFLAPAKALGEVGEAVGSAAEVMGKIAGRVQAAKDKVARNKVQQTTTGALASLRALAQDPSVRENPDALRSQASTLSAQVQKAAAPVVATMSPYAQAEAKPQLGNFAKQFDAEASTLQSKLYFDQARRTTLGNAFAFAGNGDLDQARAEIRSGVAEQWLHERKATEAEAVAHQLAYDFHHAQTNELVDQALTPEVGAFDLAREITSLNPHLTPEHRDALQQRIDLEEVRHTQRTQIQARMGEDPVQLIEDLRAGIKYDKLATAEVSSLISSAREAITDQSVLAFENLRHGIDTGAIRQLADFDAQPNASKVQPLMGALGNRHLAIRRGEAEMNDPASFAQLQTGIAALNAARDKESNGSATAAYLRTAIAVNHSGTQAAQLNQALDARLTPNAKDQSLLAHGYTLLDTATRSAPPPLDTTVFATPWDRNITLKSQLLEAFNKGDIQSFAAMERYVGRMTERGVPGDSSRGILYPLRNNAIGQVEAAPPIMIDGSIRSGAQELAGVISAQNHRGTSPLQLAATLRAWRDRKVETAATKATDDPEGYLRDASNWDELAAGALSELRDNAAGQWIGRRFGNDRQRASEFIQAYAAAGGDARRMPAHLAAQAMELNKLTADPAFQTGRRSPDWIPLKLSDNNEIGRYKLIERSGGSTDIILNHGDGANRKASRITVPSVTANDVMAEHASALKAVDALDAQAREFIALERSPAYNLGGMGGAGLMPRTSDNLHQQAGALRERAQILASKDGAGTLMAERIASAVRADSVLREQVGNKDFAEDFERGLTRFFVSSRLAWNDITGDISERDEWRSHLNKLNEYFPGSTQRRNVGGWQASPQMRQRAWAE